LKLLVLQSSRWREFPGNLRVAIGPVRRPLKTEISTGRVFSPWMKLSATLHVTAAAFILWIVPRLPLNLPVVIDDQPRNATFIYYNAPSLPEVTDSQPAEASQSPGPAMQEAFHPIQTIRIRRGSIIRDVVVEAPNLPLPRIQGPAASLLSLPQPAAPVLAAQPEQVVIPRLKSKITSAQTATERKVDPARIDNPKLKLPELQSVPVPAVTVAQSSKPPQLTRANTATEMPAAANLDSLAVSSASTRPMAENAAAATASSEQSPALVVSVNPGNEIGVPINGGPGTLAMSPKGSLQPPAGVAESKGSQPGAGGRTGTGNATTRETENRHGATAGGAPATGGIGKIENTMTAPAISISGTDVPARTSQGNVISLGSFGPPATRSGKPAEAKETSDPPRKIAPIVVVAAPRSGGGLNSYGVFKSQQVYTIYFSTPAGPAILEFAAGDARLPADNLTPPDPIQTPVGPLRPSARVLISCKLNAAGRLTNLKIVEGNSNSAQETMNAVSGWRFHPALSGAGPVDVDALIEIRSR
jgi:hypothetical protein